MVYYTREKVLCDFIGCNYNGQRRSLNRHYERIHGGKKPEIRNSAFGSGGRWSSWVGAAGSSHSTSERRPTASTSRGRPRIVFTSRPVAVTSAKPVSSTTSQRRPIVTDFERRPVATALRTTTTTEGETGDPDEPVATESPRSNDGQEDGAVATGTEPLDLGTGETDDPDDPDEPVATESPRSNDGQEDGAVATGTEPLEPQVPPSTFTSETTKETQSCSGTCSSCGASCTSTGFTAEDRRLLVRVEQGLQQLLTNSVSTQPGDQVKFVDELRRVLAQVSTRPGQTAGSDPTPPSSETEVATTLFRSGRSISAIQAATDGDLIWDPSGNALRCRACAPIGTNPQCGVFAYDVTVGTSFEAVAALPQRFKSLKLRVSDHFHSARHAQAKKSHQEKEANQQLRLKKDCSAETRVLRTAYLVLRFSLGHTLFEHLILLQHLNGADVGNINHSRMMMATARSAFSKAVLEKVKGEVEEQPCVAILADKVTIARRTVDITAVIMLMPDAKPEELFQSFVIAAPIVTQHDGEALAAEIRDSLASVGITSCEQISAAAMDGQYHHNGVAAKLSRMLEGPTNIPAVWDHAHLMNLAEADARRAPDIAWVQETVDLMTSINKRFSDGKGLEDLMACGVKRGQRALRPKLWSETRFAAHAAQVITVFRRNLPLLCAALEEKLTGGTRAAQLDDMEKELAQLQALTFEMRLRALEDIYSLLANFSKRVQSTQALPWERQASQTEAVDLLERMRVALVAQGKTTPTAKDRLDAAGKDELWPILLKNRTAPPLREVAGIARFCTILKERLLYRGRGCDKGGSQKGTSNSTIMDSMADICRVGDLRQLSTSCLSPPILARAVRDAGLQLAKRKLVPPSCVPTEEQIRVGIGLLREHRDLSNQQLWKKLVNSRHEGTKFTDFVTRVWLLSPPESVVESMASIIGEVFGEHRQLDHNNAAAELIVRWNGPSLCHADRLINSVRQRLSAGDTFRCTRRTTSITQALEGTVITRHKRASDGKTPMWKAKRARTE